MRPTKISLYYNCAIVMFFHVTLLRLITRDIQESRSMEVISLHNIYIYRAMLDHERDIDAIDLEIKFTWGQNLDHDVFLRFCIGFKVCTTLTTLITK